MKSCWFAVTVCLLVGCHCDSKTSSEQSIQEGSASSQATEQPRPDSNSRTPTRTPKKRVPTGLKGLSFGMSTEEAIRALPELSAGTTTGAATLSAEERAEPEPAADYLEKRREIMHLGWPQVGARIGTNTTIGKEPAYCTFDFAVPKDSARYGLSSVDCHLGSSAVAFSGLGMHVGGYRSRREHCAALEKLTEALRGKYGRPSSTGVGDNDMTAIIAMGMEQEACAEVMTWKNSEAVLELRSTNSLIGVIGDELSITNYSTEHTKAIEAASKALEAASEADMKRREIERNEREAKAEAELRRNLENAGNVQRALSDDL